MEKCENEKFVSNMVDTLFQNTRDFVFVKNEKSEYIMASNAFATECAGVNTVGNVIGKTDYEIFGNKAVVERFRQDNQILINSGEDMMEFVEEYIDKNGKEYPAIVTKYVIRDENNKPIALFGHYHDVKDRNKKIADALNNVYFASHYVDLVHHTFVVLKSMEYSRQMLKGCKTIEQGFEAFINTLVKPEFQEKVREFCDSKTIAERLKGKSHIDCEYLSKVAIGWCQVRFVPVDYDEQGNVTHVLFVVTSVDANVAKEIESGLTSQKNFKSIFDKVPGGIVQYEWDGDKLKTLHISKYYFDKYGYTLANNGSPDFSRVHPDDLVGYQEAIIKALTITQKLDYVFRVWNREEQRYVWVQINAVSEVQENGKSLVYAIYTDITEQKDAEEKLTKNREMIMESYEKQIQTLLCNNEDALVMCNINLTKNSFSNPTAEGVVKRCADNSTSLNDLFRLISFNLTVDFQRQEYVKIFNCNNLIEAYKRGENHIRYEHLFDVRPQYTEWVETVVDIVENPITRDLEGICYAKSVNKANLSHILFQKAFEKDYPMAAIVYIDTGEYYYFSSQTNDYCSHKVDYWGQAQHAIDSVVADEDVAMMKRRITKDYVLSQLKTQDSYTETFYSKLDKEFSRLEVSFSYVGKQKRLLLASVKNITDRALFDKYKYDSEHDELTGLYNKKTFLNNSKELLKQHPDELFAMINVDIRHLHLYNTFFGEKAGDQLLKDFANIFVSFDKDYDYWAFGRAEGDLFCACFPFDRDKFNRHINQLFEDAKKYREDFLVEILVGTYLIDDRDMPLESVLTRAAIAANSLQETSGSGVAFFNKEMEEYLTNNQKIINDMQNAIEEEEFKVYLQPKYNLRTDEMVGAEALVRWFHHSKGIISPGDFIPIFESNGFIAELDRYMWEHVCQLLRKWKQEGKPLIPISVNVSRISIYNPKTVQFLIDLVKKYDIDPKYLELELTESAYMDDPIEIKKQLVDLKEAGFVILMDDFGSGYSSLNTLREFPVDVLKLDMKFFSHKKEEDIKGSLVIASVIRMSKLLDIAVIAEGVELKEEANYLRSIGCEYAQGYLYNKPMPVEDYEKLLLNDKIASFEDNKVGNKKVIEMVGDYSVDMNQVVEAFPLPIAVLEYSDDRFAFVRANRLCLNAFKLTNEDKAGSVIFKENSTSEEYQKFINGLAKCVDKKGKLAIKFTYGLEKEEQTTYLLNLLYKGRSVNNHLLLATFTPTDDYEE